MTIPTSQNLYGVGIGSGANNTTIFATVDPNINSINYPLNQQWINTTTNAIWVLEKFLSAGGTITAQWRAIGPIVVATTDPTNANYLYPIGQTWVNTSSKNYWVLLSISGTTATWSELSSNAGLVTSVSGTAAQIDVTPNIGDVVVSIDSGYVGQTSITTLGTVTTGTWEGTKVGVAYGGTGDSTFTPYAVITAGSTAMGALQNVSGVGTAAQVLTSQGASMLPVWASASAVGTFTPTVTFGGSSTGITYSVQVGKYYVIGQMVFFNWQVTFSSIGSLSGTFLGHLGTAPDSANDSFNQIGGVATQFVALDSGYTFIHAALLSNSNTFSLLEDGSNTAIQNLVFANFANNSSITVSGFYWTA